MQLLWYKYTEWRMIWTTPEIPILLAVENLKKFSPYFFFFFHLFVKVAALETPELLLRAIFQAIQPFQIKFVHFKSRNKENSFPFSCSNYLLPWHNTLATL